MDIQEYTQEVSTELMELLLTADPDQDAVEVYLREGTILVSVDNDIITGIAVMTNVHCVFELKNISVSAEYQGKGIAKALIHRCVSLAKASGATSIELGTGNSSLDQLALYQKCGFRITHVVKDFFASYPEPIYENGIRCLDMVRLRAEI